MTQDAKVAIVTGGCRGIGLAATEIFLEQGWHVAVVDRDTEELHRVCDTMNNVLAVEADLAVTEPEHAEDRLHGGGLAGAVRSDDDGDLTLVDGDGALVQDVGAAVAAGHRLADQVAHANGPVGSPLAGSDDPILLTTEAGLARESRPDKARRSLARAVAWSAMRGGRGG